MRLMIGTMLLLAAILFQTPADAAQELRVGFAERDITPNLDADKPVWIAGYGHGRQATGVHDPIMARAVVLNSGDERIALVSVDLVGLQYPEVNRIRAGLKGFRYVLVASTHNHEGPDVIGIWGKNPFRRGADDDYLELVVNRCVEVVEAATNKLQPATAAYGTIADDSLLRDSRLPVVKDGVLRVLKFNRVSDGRPLGLVTQFSCHPESLGSRNTLLTADFPHVTIQELKAKFDCPVVYFSGAVGGLMTNPTEPLSDAEGRVHHDGTFEYARLYGQRVAARFASAVESAQPVELTPFHVNARQVTIPVENQIYRAARELGVLKREASAIEPTPGTANGTQKVAMPTEVGYVRLGELHIAGIPGELYPELVYGRIQSPVEPGADFPDAELEPSVEQCLPGEKWLLIGLANDEIGYIIPKRQWDDRPPFCYGRSKSQYGEINSCGPDVAPTVMKTLRELTREL